MNRNDKHAGARAFTHPALAIALAMGTIAGTALVSDPAMAAKAKAEQTPKLKLSPAFQAAIAASIKSFQKNDFETSKTELAASEALIQSNDDRFQYHSMMLNIGLSIKDTPMQIKGLRGMLDTGLVPPDKVGQYSSIVSDAVRQNEEHDAAISYARMAQAAGYSPAQVYPLLAQAQWGKAGKKNLSAEPQRSLVVEGLTNFRKGIEALQASGQPVPSQWFQVAIGKADAAGLPEIKQWAQWAFEAEPNGENLRTILRIFQRENPTMTNRENLDLLRLMHWSGGLALSADFSEYAEMAGKSGIFGEVLAVIDEGKRNGVLGSAGGGEFYSTASQEVAGDKASLPTAEADSRKAATGKIAAATGAAYLGYANYAKAIELYQLALQKGSVDANEVNTHIGIAMAKNGDKPGALEAFAKVQGPIRGQLARYWADYVTRRAAASAAAAAPAAAPSAQ